jgi:CoA:oxalate CoA-transferase
MATSSHRLPLSGLRILDIGQLVAGPFCARLLARLGADVIKVEAPGVGDPCRQIGPFPGRAAKGESGALHLYVDEGKRGITLDLRSRTGRDLFLRLVEKADAIVENLDPEALSCLDLDYGTLSTTNPRIVLTSISNFGASGPYRGFKGRELTVFAMGGHVYKSGTLGRPPLRMGGSPAQYLAAISAAYATMLGLRTAEINGIGQYIDFSILESQATSHAQAMVEVSYYDEETGAKTPRAPADGRRLMAKDGPVMFSVQEQQMARLAALIGAPPQLGRPNPMQRGAGRAALQEYITSWASERTQIEFYTQGQDAHIPASYVASPADLLHSPQYRHRGFFLETTTSDGKSVSIPGLPFQWYGVQAAPRPAPLLGQHNREVYFELPGMDDAALATLFAAGVI